MEGYVQCSHCGVRNPIDVRAPYAIAECVKCGRALPLLKRPSAKQPPAPAPVERVGIEPIGDELALNLGESDSGTGEEAMKPPAAAPSEDELHPLTRDAVNAMFVSWEDKGTAAPPPADETELPTRHAVDAIINAAADAPSAKEAGIQEPGAMSALDSFLKSKPTADAPAPPEPEPVPTPPAEAAEIPKHDEVGAIFDSWQEKADAAVPPAPEPAPAPPVEAAETPRRDEVGAIFDTWESKADAPALPPAQEPEIPKLEAVTASAAPNQTVEPLVVAACIAITLIGGLVAVSFFTTGPQEPIVTPQAFGRLELEIAPRPSEVRVGATKIELAAGGLKLPAGAHRVEARFDDLASIMRQVEVTPGKTARLEILAYREIGQELEKRGKRDDARRSYEEALARAGDDAERKELRDAVTRLTPVPPPVPLMAALSVISEPAGAEVLLDGRPAGQTPLTLEKVEPGTRRIEVRRGGYAPEERQVVAETGKTQSVNVALKLLTGTVRVAGLRAGDRVKVEPKEGGAAREVEVKADGKVEVEGLKPGGYRVLVERADHYPGQAQVVVVPGRVAEVPDPGVADRRGTLVVEVHPEGSQIEGAVQGVTRARGVLVAGVHKLRAKHPEAGEEERVATVRRGEETVEMIDLWEIQGGGHLQARRLEEAEQAFRRARPLARGSGLEGVAKAWLDRANERRIAGDLPAARKSTEQALRLKPGDAQIKERLSGIVYAEGMVRANDHAEKGDWAAARAAADECLKIRPGDVAATTLVAECSFRAALARAEKAAAAGDMNELLRASAEALALRPGDARAKALADKASPPRTPLERARESRRAGKWTEARDAYREALGQRPDDAEARAATEMLEVLDWTELRGAAGEARSLAFHPRGESLAVGAADGKIALRAAQDLSEQRTWEAHAGPVRAVAFSGDGRRLASWGEDGAVHVWDLRDGSRRTCPSRDPALRAMAYPAAGDRLAAGREDGSISIWLISFGEALMALGNHDGAAVSLSFGSRGSRMASGGADGAVKIWNVDKASEVRALKAHAGPVGALAFDADEKRIASGGQDGAIRLWNAETGEESRAIAAGGPVRHVAFASGGRLLASSGEDGAVRLWDAEGATEVRKFAHAGRAWGFVFHPDGRLLATTGADGVKLWGPKR